jgi:prepilin-type N-terminal cleavage/methylation domain-containing protein
MKQAFSLVELSIVLVILGLLTGGILAGQSLIRAAELRSITTQYSQYGTAVNSFKDRYFQLPGDINNATSFWGKDNVNCSAHTGSAATNGTCNGDGNGTIAYGAAAANMTGESFQFWRQLALAGNIEGSYSGLSGPGYLVHSQSGINVPKGRLQSSGWSVFNYAYSGISNFPELKAQNNLWLGGDTPTGWNYAPFLKSEEVWNIDTKIDDGKPLTGRLFVVWWNACTNAANSADIAASYAFSNTGTICSIVFPNAIN